MLLVRHGSTASNDASKPVVRGWQDLTLTPKGVQEVKMLAKELREYAPQAVVSSDFMRDTETAMILADQLGISDKKTDFDSRTWDVGTFSGQPEDEVNPAIQELYRRSSVPPPGSLESFDEFAARWLGFLDRMMAAASIEAMRPYIVVTHGRNIALTDSHFNFKLPEEGMMPMPAGFGVLSIGLDRRISFELQGETECVCIDV